MGCTWGVLGAGTVQVGSVGLGEGQRRLPGEADP